VSKQTMHSIALTERDVRAVLAGEQTVFRREVKAARGRQAEWLSPALLTASPSAEVCSVRGALGVQLEHPKGGPLGWVRCPYGGVGDQLWVQETWAYYGGDEYLYQCDPDAVAYRATYADDVRVPLAQRWYGKPPGGRWRPSIHMPPWASRITLNVVNVRVERLHGIDDADALREGVKFYDPEHLWDVPEPPFTPREVFNHLWARFKGVASWRSNPWVWRIEFKAKEKAR
jgi:hypothetical protein